MIYRIKTILLILQILFNHTKEVNVTILDFGLI